MRHIFPWLLCIFLFPASLCSQISKLKAEAKAGDPKAMLELSEKFLFGFGVDQSDDSSQYWLSQALATGSAEAQYLIGLQYTGMALSAKQYNEGIDLLRKAADQDHPASLLRLSEIYRQRNTGTDSDRFYNLSKAYHFAIRSGQLGDREGMTYTAECLLQGKGTDRNDSLGVAWMRKAADEKRFFPAMVRMGELMLAGTGCEHPEPFEALHYFRSVIDHPQANIEQKSLAKIGIHEVDKVLKELQNAMFEAGSFLPEEAFQYEIRE